MTVVMKNYNIKEEILRIVKDIPRGKVLTYGSIAKQVHMVYPKYKVNPRYIGYILHLNVDPVNIPCHRVVDRNGKLAENYKFGGLKEQKRKLLEEGVKFVGNKNVDLKKFLYLT